MDDNRIEIVAGLDLPKTKSTIKDELKDNVKPYLDQSKALNIICHIDDESIASLQSELNKISKGLKLDIPTLAVKVATNTNTGSKVTAGIEKSVEQTTQKVLNLKKTLSDLDGKFTKPFKAVLDTEGLINAERTMAKIQDRLSSLGTVTVTGKYNDDNSADSLYKIQATINATSGEIRTLNFLLDETGEKFQLLDSSYSDKGVVKVQQDIVRLKKELASFEASHTSIKDGLTTPLTEARNAIINLESGIGSVESAEKALDNLKTSAANIATNLKSTGSSFNVFDNAVNKAENFGNTLKSLEMDINNLGASEKKSNLANWLSEATQGLEKLKALETESGKGQEWSAQYKAVSSIIQDITNNLKVAQKEDSAFNKEFNTALKEEEKLLQAEQKRVQVAKELREEQAHEYWQGRFNEEIKAMTAENQVLKDMKRYYEDLAKAAEDFEGTKSRLSKQVDSKINTLTTQSRNRVFVNNGSNTAVSDQLAEINEVSQKYRELLTMLSEAKSPEALIEIQDKLANLDDEFKSVVSSSKSLQNAMRNDKATSAFSDKINELAADMKVYENANKRAIESTKKMSSGQTFADTWASLTARMSKGAQLTEVELQKLTADFRIFGKEAEVAGLKGAGVFEKFKKSFGVISTYISANQIINMAISKIREATTELKNIDDTLTEISKTSDRTDESLRKLGRDSFDAASEYGRTANDYLLGVQEMSRAGFNETESEGLAKLSILAQAAGDMTADLANEYLIATNAAYGYNGSLEQLNNSLDRQNYVTNHYALSMTDLAEATKLASSQAAQSGVEIDEMTAALATMISTTQQGGTIAARAFRGILMNIQQVKGEVGDGEDDITAESLSKYEKAAADLGVALKETRNGAVALRDPMVVLEELAKNFNKEAEDSIKRANLISAVGGKYRGNQLSALLKNWDTYKEILDTFNSDQAAGSALSEAEKSANNWAGSLNKVKNSWSELVNKFIDSDNAVDVLQSIDNVIQNLSSDETMNELKVITSVISEVITVVSELTKVFGTLPVAITAISTITSVKEGKGRPKPNMPIYAPLQFCA